MSRTRKPCLSRAFFSGWHCVASRSLCNLTEKCSRVARILTYRRKFDAHCDRPTGARFYGQRNRRRIFNRRVARQESRVVFLSERRHSWCTSESIAFRDLFESFSQAGAVIAGISRDSLKSHEAFKTKYTLPFELIADIDEALCTLFDVIKIKKMYGKAVRGVERSTFLIDERGVLRREWRSVKVAGHVEAVLEAVQSL